MVMIGVVLIDELTRREFDIRHDAVDRAFEDFQVELRLRPVGFHFRGLQIGFRLADGDAILIHLGDVFVDVIGFREHVAGQLLTPGKFPLVPGEIDLVRIDLRGIGRMKEVQRKLRFLDRCIQFGERLDFLDHGGPVNKHLRKNAKHRTAKLDEMPGPQQTGADIGLNPTIGGKRSRRRHDRRSQDCR